MTATPVLCLLWYLAISTAFAFSALLLPPRWRLILGVGILYSALQAFHSLQHLSWSPNYTSIIGLHIIVWLLHIFNVLLLQHQTIEDHTQRERWHTAYKWLFNERWLRTSRVVSQTDVQALPALSSWSRTLLHQYTPRRLKTSGKPVTETAVGGDFPRLVFLARRLILCIVLFTLNHFYETHIILTPRPELYNPLAIDDFDPARSTYVRRLLAYNQSTPPITIRETVIRLLLVPHFVWTSYSTYTFAHSALSIVFVGIFRLDEPGDWPQLFGSLANTFTLRAFWGQFWHRLVYRSYTSPAKVLTKTLGFRSGGIPGRWLVWMLVFLLSGMVHVLVEWRIGVCGYIESVRWYLLNCAAMVLEDSIMRMARQYLPPRSNDWLLWRVLGYSWVWGFMFWSLPKGQYEKIWCTAHAVARQSL